MSAIKTLTGIDLDSKISDYEKQVKESNKLKFYEQRLAGIEKRLKKIREGKIFNREILKFIRHEMNERWLLKELIQKKLKNT